MPTTKDTKRGWDHQIWPGSVHLWTPKKMTPEEFEVFEICLSALKRTIKASTQPDYQI